MPGQATVAIKDKQWSVGVANTYAELAQGLSGISSLPAGTGMLFDLGTDQSYIQIDMSRMLFPLDIIFINSTQGIVGVMHDIQPGETDVRLEATTPRWAARCFLEVNADEAEGVEVGDNVAIQGLTPQNAGLDLTGLMNFMVIMVVVVMMFRVVDRALEAPKERPRMLGYGKPPPGYVPVHHSSEREQKLWYLGEWWEEEYSTAECVVYRSADGKKRLYVYWDGTKEVKPAPHLGNPPVCSKCGSIIFRTTEKYYDTPQGIFCFGCVPKIYKTTEYEKVYKPVSREHHSAGEDKYIVERAREISRKTGEPFEETLRTLRAPIEAPHYRVLGWIVREDPGCLRGEFGLATGITVNPDLPEKEKKVVIAHEIGHGESICKKLKAGEEVAFGREFERLAWQEGIPAAEELGILDEYLKEYQKEAKYLAYGHHSMWLTLEQREDLQEKYGTVAVRWAEEATRPGDIKGAEAAAEYYYGKLKEALGLGHLSPQLTEEQIRKLREVLGLTADVAEILKIHRETGYIP